MKQIVTVVFGLLTAGLAHSAIITYDVFNYDGGTAAHGLWTASDYSTDNTFSVLPGVQFIIDDQDSGSVADDVATLTGSMVATGFDPDVIAVFDLTFTGGQSSLTSDQLYKQEQGLPEGSLVDPMFWANVAGTITIGNDIYDVNRFVVGADNKLYTFQFGVGANAKNALELGGSAWIQTCKTGLDSTDVAPIAPANACMDSHHWDLNLSMVRVPEPGTLLLLGVGLLGIGLVRRKRS